LCGTIFSRHGVLCRTPRGTLLRRDYFNREIWKPAVTAAQLPEDTTFHDLRHTFASTALAEGVPISEVSRWLGHKSITTTVDLYTWSPRPAVAPVTHSTERLHQWTRLRI
jgi:integrase